MITTVEPEKRRRKTGQEGMCQHPPRLPGIWDQSNSVNVGQKAGSAAALEGHTWPSHALHGRFPLGQAGARDVLLHLADSHASTSSAPACRCCAEPVLGSGTKLRPSLAGAALPGPGRTLPLLEASRELFGFSKTWADISCCPWGWRDQEHPQSKQGARGVLAPRNP